MKRQLALFGALALVMVSVTGCINTGGMAYGFPAVAPGLVYSDAKFGGYVEENMDAAKRPYVNLGTVTGTSKAVNVLLLVSTGDASNVAAERDALNKVKGADAIINRVYDAEHFSILSVFSVATNRVTGEAIRYTDTK